MSRLIVRKLLIGARWLAEAQHDYRSTSIVKSDRLLEGYIELDGAVNPESIPLALALYNFYGTVTAYDEEDPGSGERLLASLRIADGREAEALVVYMRAALFAGRGSSAKREREFCSREVGTLSDLVEASVARQRDHNEELERLVGGAAEIVGADTYTRLVEYAEESRANLHILRFDPEAYYAANPGVDIEAEMERRCD